LARSPCVANAQVSSFQITVYWSSGPSTYTCTNGASCITGTLSCVTFPCYVNHRITTNSGWRTVRPHSSFLMCFFFPRTSFSLLCCLFPSCSFFVDRHSHQQFWLAIVVCWSKRNWNHRWAVFSFLY
jgi:hypothetical protein